jgi:hypothetical protein
MAIKELISRTTKWFASKKNDKGLYEPLQGTQSRESGSNPLNIVPIRLEPKPDRTETLQMIQNSFEQLVNQLGGINDHLGRQVEQNAELLKRIDEIPQLLQNFPESMKTQKFVVESLIEQLKSQALKNQQFSETVAKIPAASEEQTAAVREMAGQVAAQAAVDTQILEGMRKFNNITDKLNGNVAEQAQSINQMSRAFTAGDQYLKYVINTQHKRFMWVFVGALTVCTLVIIALLIVIFVLK